MNKVRKVISKYKPYKEQNRNPGAEDTMTEWKNSIEIFNNWLYHTEGKKKFFKLMDRLFETNRRGKKWEKMKNSWRKFPWVTGLSSKWTFTSWKSQEKRERKGNIFLFKELTAENLDIKF